MIAMLCATLGGVTIVLSRSVNGYLSQKIGPYQSTFYNYLTGSILSFLFMCFLGLPYLQDMSFATLIQSPFMLLGGMIGVFNILILNIVVSRVSPVQLTLLTFVSQLMSGMILDYCFYNIFSLQKMIGCLIVIGGLVLYQLSSSPKVDDKKI